MTTIVTVRRTRAARGSEDARLLDLNDVAPELFLAENKNCFLEGTKSSPFRERSCKGPCVFTFVRGTRVMNQPLASATVRRAFALPLAVLFLWVALGICTVAHAGSKWETIARESGIRVLQKDRSGSGIPMVKGIGMVKANLADVLAVIDDVPGRTTWAHDCTDSRELEKPSPFERVLYHRSAVTWPVSDRDVVVRVKVDADYEAKRVKVTYKTAHGYSFPKVSGVVRMPRLDGYFLIQAVGAEKTRVTYLVDADPGGMLPDWLVTMTSKDIPLNTLQNLRKRVRRTKANGKYKKFVDYWQPLFFPPIAKADTSS